jgi:hypothetical protein
VMSGESGAHKEAVAAFEHALRTIMLVAAACAVLSGLIGWLWIGSSRASARH